MQAQSTQMPTVERLAEIEAALQAEERRHRDERNRLLEARSEAATQAAIEAGLRPGRTFGWRGDTYRIAPSFHDDALPGVDHGLIGCHRINKNGQPDRRLGYQQILVSTAIAGLDPE